MTSLVARKKLLPLLAVILLILPGAVSRLNAADIDFSKALRIGNGPKTVVEFTDPDCPYCRQASRYLDGRRDLTRLVFFYPLPRHPKARDKVRYILSQSDRAKAYHDAMSGRLDGPITLASSPDGDRLQQEQYAIAVRSGIRFTPTIMANGRIVSGFDVKKLEELLGK